MLARYLTVIYRTSNREHPAFEAAVQAQLLRSAAGLPLISVSQQPLALGQNICVGDVGVSNVNTWRQLQIGVEAARTPIVCTAEADFLHAPDYFRFFPPHRRVCYIPHPIYVCFARKRNRQAFWPKHGCQGALVANRSYLLRCLDALLRGRKMWESNMGRDILSQGVFAVGDYATFPTAVPTVTFKTDRSMHEQTGVGRPVTDRLPYWGDAPSLIRAYHADAEDPCQAAG